MVLSSTDCWMTVRSTSLLVIYLLLLVDLVPFTLLDGDFLGIDGGRGSIGLAGGDTLATSSFNLLDCRLFRGTLGITYVLDRPLEVDGWTSGTSAETTSFAVVSSLGCDGVLIRNPGWGSVLVSESLSLVCCWCSL